MVLSGLSSFRVYLSYVFLHLKSYGVQNLRVQGLGLEVHVFLLFRSLEVRGFNNV